MILTKSESGLKMPQHYSGKCKEATGTMIIPKILLNDFKNIFIKMLNNSLISEKGVVLSIEVLIDVTVVQRFRRGDVTESIDSL